MGGAEMSYEPTITRLTGGTVSGGTYTTRVPVTVKTARRRCGVQETRQASRPPSVPAA
jgi:hypothetical protein